MSPFSNKIVLFIKSVNFYFESGNKCFNFTLSPSRNARIEVLQDSCISPALFNFSVSTYFQSRQLTNLHADNYSDSKVSHLNASLVGTCSDERGLAIFDTKSPISLFTPQFQQYSTNPYVHMNNSLLPLENHPPLLGITFNTRFIFFPYIVCIPIIYSESPCWNKLRPAK